MSAPVHLGPPRSDAASPAAPGAVTVVGEALVDLVSTPDGGLAAVLGGAPFNTARALGRLDVPVGLRAAISEDRFGGRLLDTLVADGVATDRVRRCAEPTTLALAEVDADGSADYRFYVEGTSCTVVPDVTVPSAGWLFTGGLALVFESVAEAVEGMLGAAAGRLPIMVDVNCRPRVVPAREPFVERVLRVVALADVVKVSDEDLGYIFPGVPTADAVGRLHTLGASVVIATAGAAGVTVHCASGVWTEPVPPVAVVDTIGAGDTFDAGFLARLVAVGDGVPDRDALSAAVRAGVAAAAVVVGRRGADPPRRDELDPAVWAGPLG
jgi:fructokinase